MDLCAGTGYPPLLYVYVFFFFLKKHPWSHEWSLISTQSLVLGADFLKWHVLGDY